MGRRQQITTPDAGIDFGTTRAPTMCAHMATLRIQFLHIYVHGVLLGGGEDNRFVRVDTNCATYCAPFMGRITALDSISRVRPINR